VFGFFGDFWGGRGCYLGEFFWWDYYNILVIILALVRTWGS
jgi:hypothetical protein